MTDRFKQFVQEQKKQADTDAAAMTPEQDKQRWLGNLQDLDVKVRGWLAEYAAEGDIEVSTEDVLLNEERVGYYKAPQVKIRVGSNWVKLKPIGTFLIGAYGRVDMEGPRGICRLILVPANATGPKILFNTPLPPEQPVELAWKITSPPPTIKYIDLTKESFLDQMIKVVQGV